MEHERCTVCGAVNGPFERLGNGICNKCLDRRVKRTKNKKGGK